MFSVYDFKSRCTEISDSRKMELAVHLPALPCREAGNTGRHARNAQKRRWEVKRPAVQDVRTGGAAAVSGRCPSASRVPDLEVKKPCPRNSGKNRQQNQLPEQPVLWPGGLTGQTPVRQRPLYSSQAREESPDFHPQLVGTLHFPWTGAWGPQARGPLITAPTPPSSNEEHPISST